MLEPRRLPVGVTRRLRAPIAVTLLVLALPAARTPARAAAGATPDSMTGMWSGTVTAPQGATTLTIALARDSVGQLVMTFDMPVMHCHAYPFTGPVACEGDSCRFEPLQMSWRRTGSRLAGTFGFGELPMALHRGGRFAREPRPPTVRPGPAPLWTAALGAPTRATPVVADGVVYVGASDGRVHALRAADGAEVWTWSGPHPVDGTAVVAGDALYLVDRRLELLCLERASGALRWRHALHDSTHTGGAAPENATFTRRVSTPLVLAGTVYAGSSDGGLYALDAASGAVQWRFEAGTPVYSAIGHVGGDTLAFGGMDGSLVLFDRRARHELLRVHARGPVVSTPVLVANRLVAGSRDYTIHAFDVRDTTHAWRFSYWFSWVESTPAVAGGTLYVGASDYRRVTAFDAATGRVRWANDVGGMTWGTPALDTRTVYAATASQRYEGTVIHHEGGIVALDRRTGAVRWRYAAPAAAVNALGGFGGSLALADGRLFAAGFDGTVLALPAN